MAKMKRLASGSEFADRVKFFGHVTDREELRKLYEHALVSASPGYVGLSITQSFAFGVPMIISQTEPHSPEIEAAIAGFNCAFFETDNADDFARVLSECFESKTEWLGRRSAIALECANAYSTELMAERLLGFLRS
ncbi:hypothetical protein GCM10027431_07270 [Lysobacter rhizosphaerae]